MTNAITSTCNQYPKVLMRYFTFFSTQRVVYSPSPFGRTFQVLSGHMRLVATATDGTVLEGRSSKGRDPVRFLHVVSKICNERQTFNKTDKWLNTKMNLRNLR